MSGVIIPVLDKKIFEFSFLAAGAQDVVLQPAIETAGFYRVRLLVRVHALNVSGGTPSNFDFKLQHTLPSDSDPQEFTDTSSDFQSPVNSRSLVPW